MKFAREVIDLMGSYPGRDFRMSEIIRYAAPTAGKNTKERRAIHRGVLRVLEILCESHQVLKRPARAGNGGYQLYRWKPRHEVFAPIAEPAENPDRRAGYEADGGGVRDEG